MVPKDFYNITDVLSLFLNIIDQFSIQKVLANKSITYYVPTIYCKFPKYSDTQKICFNHSKIWIMWLYHRVMSPNDANGMANSVDPDQTAPLAAVWSGSALFAQAYLSENLASLRKCSFFFNEQLSICILPIIRKSIKLSKINSSPNFPETIEIY